MYYIFKNNTTLQQIKKQAIRTKGACFLKKQKKLGYEIKQQTPYGVCVRPLSRKIFLA